MPKVQNLWESWTPRALKACPALYLRSFTFHPATFNQNHWSISGFRNKNIKDGKCSLLENNTSTFFPAHPLAVRSKKYACGPLTSEIAGSNPAISIDLRLLYLLLCVVYISASSTSWSLRQRSRIRCVYNYVWYRKTSAIRWNVVPQEKYSSLLRKEMTIKPQII